MATSPHGQELLDALVGFIRPIVCTYAPASVSSVSNGAASLQSDVRDGILLEALKSFVKATILVHGQVVSEKIKSEESQMNDINYNTSPVKGLTLAPSLSMPDEKIQGEIMTSLRRRVFNIMPIRMLAFDSSGSGIRLVDRNEMIKIVFPKACAEAATSKFSRKYLSTIWTAKLIENLVQKYSTYAILSHTWIRDTPGDIVFGDWHTRVTNPRGYSKITKFCEVAAKHYRVTLGWMDTVCINKESSSELDESIRSMYKWYKEAVLCVAYMSETESIESMHNDSWFTRGWTLQELLAPTHIQFYDKNWDSMDNMQAARALYTIGNVVLPGSLSLIQKQIERATTITKTEIDHCRCGRPDLIPISRKFQLAASRKVTRVEDQVYSLMGLLDVNISVAYGEGLGRALYRLQREILTTKKNPLDIFNCISGHNNTILPTSLSQYRIRSDEFNCYLNTATSTLELWTPHEPLMCTHLGIRLQVLLIPGIRKKSRDDNYQWTPKGNFFGETIVSYFSDKIYLLLHRDIYVERSTLADIRNISPILYLGVINFTMENNFITFPDTCLAVPINCGKTPVGAVTQLDVIKICPTSKVQTFFLNSANGESGATIKDLEIHGMQLVTLYL